jgi:hypothetical protein
MLTYPLPEIHHPTETSGAQKWGEDVAEDSSADH